MRASAALLVLFSAAFAAQAPKLVDPIFSIEYDPSQVHFREMPTTVPQLCSDLHGHYAKAWVYGDLKINGVEYLTIYGEVPGGFVHGRSIAVYPDDGFGNIVEIRGSTCHDDDFVDFMTHEGNTAQDGIAVPPKLRVEIAQDILETYAAAFGGKKQFLALITPQARGYLPPAIASQLKLYEQNN